VSEHSHEFRSAALAVAAGELRHEFLRDFAAFASGKCGADVVLALHASGVHGAAGEGHLIRGELP
jgi:hypothetical protein